MDVLRQRDLEALAVMPLAEVVLFPHTAMPLRLPTRPGHASVVERCLDQDSPLAIWNIDAVRPGGRHGPSLHRMGTLGRIGVHQRLPDGSIDVVVEGLARVRLLGESADEAPYRVVRSAMVPLEPVDPVALRPRIEVLQSVAEALAVEQPRAARLLAITLERCADPEQLSDVLCAITEDDPVKRQELLESSSIPDRLDRVIDNLSGLLLQSGVLHSAASVGPQ